MKFTHVAMIALIAVAMVFVAGCTSEAQKPAVPEQPKATFSDLKTTHSGSVYTITGTVNSNVDYDTTVFGEIVVYACTENGQYYSQCTTLKVDRMPFHVALDAQGRTAFTVHTDNGGTVKLESGKSVPLFEYKAIITGVYKA